MPSLVEIGPVVLEKKIFGGGGLMYFSYWIISSPWKRGRASFEQTWISVTQGCFLPSLVEIDPLVLGKILKIFAISLLSPLGKEMEPFIWINLDLFNQGRLVSILVEIGPVVLKKIKMWKNYRQKDRRTDGHKDNRRSEKLTWSFSSGELKDGFFLNLHSCIPEKVSMYHNGSVLHSIPTFVGYRSLM